MASLDLRYEMYLVQSYVKCKTFNFHFNSSKFVICVFLSESRLSYVINSIAADVLAAQGGGGGHQQLWYWSDSHGIFRFQHQKSWLLFFILCSMCMEVCFCLLRTGAHATVDSSHRWLWTINATSWQCRSTAWTSVRAAPPCILCFRDYICNSCIDTLWITPRFFSVKNFKTMASDALVPCIPSS